MNIANIMSNIFKTNTRFDALVNENLEKYNKKDRKKTVSHIKDNEKADKFSSFKRDNNFFKNDKFNDRKYYSEQRRLVEETEKREQEEIKKQKALAPNNFPELVFNKKQSIKIPEKPNYLEKLKKTNNSKNKNNCIDLDLQNLSPGWILIRKDKRTNKIIKAVNVKKQEILKEENTAASVINLLVELYEKRTQEYIDLNGYDTWERMFKFSNWREVEAEMEEDSDNESENESDIEEDYM